MSKKYTGILELKNLENEFNILLREYENKTKSYVLNIDNTKNINNSQYQNDLGQLKGQLETILSEIKDKTLDIKGDKTEYEGRITKNMDRIGSLNKNLNDARDEINKERQELMNADGQYQQSVTDIRKNSMIIYLGLGAIILGIFGVSKLNKRSN
jgi:chromosome segregation ATPase